MMLDYFSQIILVSITAIIALSISYMFFEKTFSYFLYFEIIFMFLFVSLGVIDYYYLAIAILLLAIVIYNLVAPCLKGDDEK